LYGHRYLLPGDRALRDHARAAFAAQERAALKSVREGVPERQLRIALGRLFAKRKGPTGATVLEWLRTPPGKHGHATLRETTQKLAYLKTLGVHEWQLGTIALPRMHAYGQAVMHRPPAATARLSDDQRTLELCCFLYITLLELTDLTADIAARRVCDLVRNASGRVQQKQASSSIDLRAERVTIKSILYAPGLTDQDKVAALRELLPQNEPEVGGSRAALVRQFLVEESAPKVSALLNSLATLDVRGDESHRAMRQIRALRELSDHGANELPLDFDVSMADAAWHPMLRTADRKKALAALKACAMNSIRKGVRGGKLWLAHSGKHRDRQDQLIAVDEWQKKRKSFVRAMSLTDDPQRYIERVVERLSESLALLGKAADDGLISIDPHGRIHIDPIQALEVDPQVARSRDAMFDIIGDAQQGDLLVEIDAQTGFSGVLLGHKAKDIAELKAVYGALLAHGTENDAKGVAAMVPGLQVSQITTAMRAMESHNRLREANGRIVEFQQSFPIAKLWGRGDKASADAMTVDTSRHLHLARMEHRRRQPGVGIYVHVKDSYGIFYDQPIVLNDRQAGSAVQGVEFHNAACREDQIRLSLLAVDTHGYTNAAMAVAKLLGFDLCVRLRKISERMLYLPSGLALPESLERLRTGRVSLTKIKDGWDELLRLVASVRDGRLTAREALERLGSAARGDKLHGAAHELGKLLRTIFLGDYFGNPNFRREMHTLLNRNESVHQLQRAVHYGRIGAQRARRRDELWAISGAHTLLTNVVIAWNTMKMQEVADGWRARKHPIEDDWLRRMGPVHFGHINFRGVMTFNAERFMDALVQRAPRQRTRASS
jgi:TnpA family transposase